MKWSILEETLSQYGSSPSVPVWHDDVLGWQSKKDILKKAYVLARVLKKYSRSRIGILLPATGLTPILVIASYLAKKTPVMLNRIMDRASFEHCLRSAGVETILTSEKMLERLPDGILAQYRSSFVTIERIKELLTRSDKLWGMMQFLIKWRPPMSKDAVVLFTSGSEALPKIVPLTHQNVLSNIQRPVEICKITSQDRLFSYLPPFHSFGFTVNLILPLVYGISVVTTPDPTQIDKVVEGIEKHVCTLLTTTPTLLSLLLEYGETERLKSLRMIVIGGERCSPELYERCNVLLPHVTLIEGYGATECSPVISLMPQDNIRKGTVGKLLPQLDAKILDDDLENEVAEGLLCVRGPSVFAGYEGTSPAKGFCERDGERYYCTGDVASIDDDGYVVLQGRASRCIKLGGEMISLARLEHLTDSAFGQKKVVFLIDHGDQKEYLYASSLLPVEKNEIMQVFSDAGMSSLVKLKEVIRVESFPVLGSGKIDYKTLAKNIFKSTSGKKEELLQNHDLVLRVKQKIVALADGLTVNDITKEAVFGKDIYLDSIDVGELMVFIKHEMKTDEIIDPSTITTFGDLEKYLR